MTKDPLQLLAAQTSRRHFRLRAILAALQDFSLLRARTLSHLVFSPTENRNYARAEIQDLLRALRDFGYVDLLAQKYREQNRRPRRHLYFLTRRGLSVARSIAAGLPLDDGEPEAAELAPAVLNVNWEKTALIGEQTHEQMVDQLILALHEGARRAEVREKGVRIEAVLAGPTFEPKIRSFNNYASAGGGTWRFSSRVR